MTVVFSDKEKKFRGFALTRGSDSTRSSMSTPVTLKTEVDSESTRRCMLYISLHVQFLIANCIHHLSPPACDTQITSRLRKATAYPRLRNRTNCYKSFIHHVLIKYQ